MLKKTTLKHVAEGELFSLQSDQKTIWIRGKHHNQMHAYEARRYPHHNHLRFFTENNTVYVGYTQTETLQIHA